ncbi:hypothetical protein Dimus_017948, partial [Dionaea muscipula]
MKDEVAAGEGVAEEGIPKPLQVPSSSTGDTNFQAQWCPVYASMDELTEILTSNMEVQRDEDGGRDSVLFAVIEGSPSTVEIGAELVPPPVVDGEGIELVGEPVADEGGFMEDEVCAVWPGNGVISAAVVYPVVDEAMSGELGEAVADGRQTAGSVTSGVGEGGLVREEGRAPPGVKEALRPQPTDGLRQLPQPPKESLP